MLEQSLGGSPDPDVASVCQQEQRILITLDTGFADIRTYPPTQFPELVVLRLRRQDTTYVLQILARLIRVFSSGQLEHHLWIVEENQIRIRD